MTNFATDDRRKVPAVAYGTTKTGAPRALKRVSAVVERDFAKTRTQCVFVEA
ncbi:hypothetical protein [Candidatus Korobacter versatilis]|uniref:hypothetical protein n=1 Tax=Candidatus Korobacter versatilis TaxID=658062 RepID=UPI001650D434|nr:hypothetical protein [Candidatus Koribacter versatilis]